MSSALIFDRNRVKLHRNRAAALRTHDTLLAEMAERMCERIADMNRTFPVVLDLGAHDGIFAQRVKGRGNIQTLVQSDLSQAMIVKADGLRVVADEEFLPFAENSFDLCISIASMHWINDLPGALVQIRRVLKADGLFMAVLPGGQTLKELRQSFEQAEMEVSGGVSPRVSPFIDVRDAGSLLARAGFADPVTDSELVTIEYEHPLKLLKDLRAMGETNALLASHKYFTPCSLVMLMADYYLRHFSNAEGRVNATLELVTMTAWKSR